jgi:hypothetical protein
VTVSLHGCVEDPGLAADLRRRSHRSTEVDLCWIARQLGLLDRSRRTIIDKVRSLAARSGFPLPKNPRIVKGERITGPNSIDAYSIWNRDAVELWIENDRPPPEGVAAALVRRNAAADEMARRASNLIMFPAVNRG